jgi:LacI family transcriptional regulator
MITAHGAGRRRPSRVTLRDVARLAGVSISVVSRELNADPVLRARDDTRQRIHDAARALDYTPSHAARALRLAKAGAVGLIVPDVTNPVFGDLIRGIEDATEAAGLQLLIGRFERLRPGGHVLRELVGQGRVDGFLVQRSDEIDVREFTEIMRDKVPFVVVNSRGTSRGSAVLDDASGARLATEHLLELGHRRIALIGGDVHSYTGRMRAQGFLQALNAAGLRRRSTWLLHAGYTHQAGYAAMRQLCAGTGRRPTAVVVANVVAAIGALVAVHELGLAVPDQISIVAIHDTWLADCCWPPLTTVKMPMYELGREAVQLLSERLSGGRPSDIVVSEPAPMLVRRASTAPPPRRVVRAGKAADGSSRPAADALPEPGRAPL